MSIFSKILSKVGLGKKEAAPEPTPAATQAPVAAAPAPVAEAAAAPAAPAPVDVVQVLADLEAKAQASGKKLNWRVSIADLLLLLGLDNSLAARKELAQELGCPADKIGGDYSQMNIWLHKTVLQKIAENGGNIPSDLL